MLLKQHTEQRAEKVKRLRASALRPGDIILTTSDSLVSKGIRKKTRSDISHAMVYVQGHAVIDATAEGVQGRNTQRLIYDDKSAIHVLRLRRDLIGAEALEICNYARNAIGTEYTTVEAARSAYGGSKKSTRKQFCSRLAARAYASAGINLVADPHYCTPDNLKGSPHLLLVPDVTEPVSQAEFEIWSKRLDFPQMMRDSTNTLLKAARECERSIQSVNDIDRHLVEHPEDDDFMCRALDASSYLTLWVIETDENPWQYDVALMDRVPDATAVEEYCKGTLADETIGTSRYFVNRGGYVMLSQQYGLRYFSLKLELYEILAALHRRRVEVAKRWLESRNFPAPIAEAVLRPHTATWFAALEVWNPQQAAITRYVIEQTGSADVCSICGDDPARDYRLPALLRPAGGVDTLRLCDECLDIRQRMGEHYVPLTNDTVLDSGASGTAR